MDDFANFYKKTISQMYEKIFMDLVEKYNDQDQEQIPKKKQKTNDNNKIAIYAIDGKYITEEGIEFIPSMKALYNTQMELDKVGVKKEDISD